jgi:outer membrane protein OmpA-like peptidoglycan-associated protein
MHRICKSHMLLPSIGIALALGCGSIAAQVSGSESSPVLAQAQPAEPQRPEERRKDQPPGQRGSQPQTQQQPGQGPRREQRQESQQDRRPAGAQTQQGTSQPERPERRQPGGGAQPAQPRTTQQPTQPPQRQQTQERQPGPGAQQPGQPRTTQQPPSGPAQPRTTQQPGQPTAPRTTQQPPPGQAPGAQPSPVQPRTTQQPGQPPGTSTAPRTTQQPPPAQAPGTQPAPTPGQPRTAQPPGRAPGAPGTPAQPQTTQQPPGQPVGTPAAAPSGQPVQPQPGVATADPRQQQQQFEAVRQQRKERVESGGRTVIEEPDRRVIIREKDRVFIRHDEAERFRLVSQDVRVERRGNENITIVRRPGDVEIVTYVDESGRLLRRVRRTRDGREFVLIDNRFRGPRRAEIFVALPPPRIVIPREEYIVEMQYAPRERIYAALSAPPIERIERPYTLDEIRFSPDLRDRMRRVDLDTINFEFGSWQVAPDQTPLLANIAEGINAVIQSNPNEVFLIEGHTDAVGSDVDNLSLSDRRAESVAVILTQNFQVPPENLTTQGYGAQQLKVQTPGPSRENRRVTIRRITPLLTGSAQ